ncbi:MAG: TonB family protein, partial [Alistipes sp.]|nr:TonB family protein [Alistipes sp.]
MELKKNPKVDVNRLRIVLLEIGLIVALLVVIAAFLYTPREVTVEKIDMNYGPVEEQITEITRQDQKPPEPPKKTEITVITDILNIVTNDTKISTEVDFAEFEEDVEIIQQVAVEEENIEDDQPFVKVEEMPTFQGGDLNTFRNWVQSKVRYPQIAQENNISGRVFLMFVVERDGSLTNIQVLQTPDTSLSDEAIRVLKTSPK